MKVISRVMAITMILCMILQSVALGVKKSETGSNKSSGTENNPYCLMYDSDNKLVEELDSMPNIFEEDTVTKGIEYSSKRMMMEASNSRQSKEQRNIKDAVLELAKKGKMDEINGLNISEENKLKIKELTEKVKKDHFIVKYRSESEGNLSSLINKKKAGTKVLHNKRSGKIETLVLDEKINPKEFAETLQGVGADKYIEYIQPDYQMEFASLDDNLLLTLTSDNTEEGKEDIKLVEDPVESNTTEKDAEVTKTESKDESDEGQQLKEEVNKVADANSAPLDQESGDITDNVEVPNTGEIKGPVAKQEVIVAVIDTGIDVSHPSLADSIWINENEIVEDGTDNDANGYIDDVSGWNFFEDSNYVYNPSNPLQSAHGTHIAGIIASATEDYNVKIMPLKVFGENGAYTSDIIDAIKYAEVNGAQIVNCSFGSIDENPALEEAITNSNMLFVCSVGNARSDLSDVPIYPACFELENIISVTSTNADGGLSYFSNYSTDFVDLAALGRDVMSTLPNHQNGKQSGTSMSAAQVSGVAATVLCVNKELDASSLRARLIQTADMLSNLKDAVKDGRQVNSDNAVKNVKATEIKQNNPESDFKVNGYNPTQDEINRLYSNSGDVIQIEAGEYFTLVLKENGSVWAWGHNYFGQLGDGTTTNRSTPVQVIGLSDVISVATSYKHCLALKSDGTVWAWGYNNYGQLGDGTRTNRSTPIQVSGLTDVVGLSAGSYHGLALKSDGSIWAWGENVNGQLGNGTLINSNIPVKASDLTNAISVVASYKHSLALKSDGTVWAWGYNKYGQLGNGTTTNSSVPLQVTALTDVADITSSYKHNLALKSDGTVWAWGENGNGELGDGTTITRKAPVMVSGITNVVGVDAGNDHSLVMKSDGTVYAWGNNCYGQLGNGTTTNSITPVQVSCLTNVIEIDAGNQDGFALESGGTVWAWGYNNYDQLGSSTANISKTPLQVTGLINAGKIAVGYDHNLVLKSDGTVSSWGYNKYGQLGNGTTTNSSILVQVSGLTDITCLDAGYYYNLAVKSDHTVWAWGYNNYGQLGDGTTTKSITPIQVDAISDVVSVAAGSNHSLALKSDGTVWAWGCNEFGQLGNGITTNSSIPVQVTELTNVVSISAGEDHSLALKSDGTVWAWGNNNYGQLGNATTTNNSTPVQVAGITDIVGFAAGYKYTLGIKSDGTVWAWGYNSFGQLGDGTKTNRSTPVQVSGLTDVVSVDTEYKHSLALKSDGTVWSWGYNSYGQLGNGTTTNSSMPVRLEGFSNVTGLGAGHHHSLAMKSDRTVLSWGENNYGQLGSKDILTISTPTQSQVFIPDVSFTSDLYTVTIPNSGTTILTVTVQAKDVYGNVVENAEVIYNLVENYSGISIDSSTGVVTVSSDAVAGSVQIEAVYGELSCTTELSLTKTNSAELSLAAATGGTYRINCSASQVRSFEGRVFTLTYDPTVLELIDLCAFTYEKELATGEIARTGITIQSLSADQITFSMDRPIANENQWSGVINLFEFKALTDGTAQIKVK